DNSTLLLQVSQDVLATRDLDHGMAIILEGLLKATDALGTRAVVFNPNGSKPLRFGAGDKATGRMGTLDRRLLNLIRNSNGDVILRSPERIRTQLELPADRELPVKSLIAFPLYSVGRLHGLCWVGYSAEMTHEPSKLDLMRSYVTRAAALVANMRLFALAEGGYRRLAAVLRSTQEAVVVTDPTERIVLANPALGAAFGVNVDEIIGRTITDAFQNPALQYILTGPIENVRGREITNAASETFYSTAAVVEAKDGKIVGRVVVLHDITRMKQLEEMKSSFVRNVSHDLRNPLTYMHTYASMLPQLGQLNEKQLEYVDNIINGVQRMHDTIGAVLDLNRIESAADELEIEPIEAQPFFESLLFEYQPAARSQGNEIVLADSAENATIYADRWSLRLALNNLLANALKYAAGTGEITIGVRESADSTIISVSDNGNGISKADQLRLFEKYYRASEPAVPSVEGSGLGLAIVKSIAQRHNGRVWVRSELGKGSTFYMALPKQKGVATKKLAAVAH
ncbi:MAG TPA: PAS domain S-box protein, partial [Anaerolineae bacterium]|nr:PAS domain S-box protein [Anaerolineae bacterium]